MADKNPFSGLKLSEQVGLGKLDQRLFTSSPPPSSEQTPKRGPAKDSPPLAIAPKSLSPTKDHEPSNSTVIERKEDPRFDIRDEPLYKATFVFTQEELEALEDLKLELRRDLDQKVTKYDLIRAALHLLLEDHATNKDKSYATKKIRRR